MKKTIVYFLTLAIAGFTGCGSENRNAGDQAITFPEELVNFKPYTKEPVFKGTGEDTWDSHIRERGFILHEENKYKMWYTGYNGGGDAIKKLGYATSDDGIHWTRYPGNPIYEEYWTEDVFVMHYQETYYMVAEGENDIAHLMTSNDGIHWTNQGDLDIRKVNGESIDPGPYGTPTLWMENGKWYLFYERNDAAIWLAVSTDRQIWTNVQDEPVLSPGPEKYDAYGVALDQIIKYKGRYYAYYHATPDEDWSTWNSDAAVSEDLIHWTKYENNPLVNSDSGRTDISSPILVNDGAGYRLYTMHDGVRVYFPDK